MEVKVGYKQTEVGVIPEDWEQTTIGEITTKVGSGITPKGGSKAYNSHGRPFVRSQNVGWGNLLLNDMAFIDDETHNGFSATELIENDVLLNITGASIGRSAVVDKRLVGGNVNQHVCIIRTNIDNIIPKLVNYFLLSPSGQRQIDSFQAGGNREGLNFGQIRSFKLAYPPTKAEQEAIAKPLSDTDALIESLEQFIVKKRNIKQGAMQELLTGKRRLPGFENEKGYKQTEIGVIPEDWDCCELREAVEFLDGQRKPVKSSDRAKMQGIYPYYGASGIVDYVNDYLFDDELILIGEDGENILSRNLPLAFRVNGKIWVNNHAHVMKPKESFDIGYLTEFIESLDYSFLNSGTAQPKLNKQTCLKIKVAKPTKAEQEAIADILSDMDTEIEALENKLTKYRQIKQGMMHNLLTGRIRLV